MATKAVEKVPPSTAAEMAEAGWTYLDVRTPEEFTAGHPKGAVNIPFMLRTAAGMTPNEEFESQVEQKFPDTEHQLLVGCKAGNRSARACDILKQKYSTLADNTGGWDGWVAAGLPQEK